MGKLICKRDRTILPYTLSVWTNVCTLKFKYSKDVEDVRSFVPFLSRYLIGKWYGIWYYGFSMLGHLKCKKKEEKMSTGVSYSFAFLLE